MERGNGEENRECPDGLGEGEGWSGRNRENRQRKSKE